MEGECYEESRRKAKRDEIKAVDEAFKWVVERCLGDKMEIDQYMDAWPRKGFLDVATFRPSISTLNWATRL